MPPCFNSLNSLQLNTIASGRLQMSLMKNSNFRKDRRISGRGEEPFDSHPLSQEVSKRSKPSKMNHPQQTHRKDQAIVHSLNTSARIKKEESLSKSNALAECQSYPKSLSSSKKERATAMMALLSYHRRSSCHTTIWIQALKKPNTKRNTLTCNPISINQFWGARI